MESVGVGRWGRARARWGIETKEMRERKGSTKKDRDYGGKSMHVNADLLSNRGTQRFV